MKATRFVLQCLFFQAICVVFHFGSAVGERQLSDENTDNFGQEFRLPKNIVFCAMSGGSSHVNWVLATLQELINRGHNTSFITRDNHLFLSKKYPAIYSMSVGAPYFSKDEKAMAFKEASSKPVTEAHAKIAESIGRHFVEDYLNLLHIFKTNKYDLAICDFYSAVCSEVANKLGIPYVVTFNIPFSEDASAPYINNYIINDDYPTTVELSFWQRINNMYVKPLKYIYSMRHVIRSRKKNQISLGLRPHWGLDVNWNNVLKIHNSGFGFFPARPLGPLVELVGPIVANINSNLTPELESFLHQHQRVAYVAFGQHVVGAEGYIRAILTGLLEAYEAQEIDGILWGTRGLEDQFPHFITTPTSNTTYDLRSIILASSATAAVSPDASVSFEGGSVIQDKDFKFMNWLPQMAILKHASTSLFITHGGMGSIDEAMYAGVRVVVHPFCVDQFANARMIEKNGVGLRIHTKDHSQEEVSAIIRRVARDDEGHLQNNVHRMQALVQIRSKHGLIKAADLVEEAVFTHVQGELPHRRDVRRDMYWWKAYNVDIYASTLLIAFVSIWSICRCIQFLWRLDYSKTKLKAA